MNDKEKAKRGTPDQVLERKIRLLGARIKDLGDTRGEFDPREVEAIRGMLCETIGVQLARLATKQSELFSLADLRKRLEAE